MSQQPSFEIRAAADVRADGSRIVGLAIPFNSRSQDLGGFVEIVRPQAVTRALDGDVVALYNHDPGAVLGRTPTTLQLQKEDRGLAFSIMPPDTQIGRETLTLVGRGDLKGASFGFRTVTDRWFTEDGTTIRELLDIDIAEISLTAFPAYQQTNVEVAQRSLQAWQALRGQRVEWLRMKRNCAWSVNE